MPGYCVFIYLKGFTVGPSTAAPDRHRHYRYYDYLMAGFVTVLLCSNLIGPAKVSEVDFSWLPLIGGVLVFGAGNIFFPISYIFGDVLTEVYGYARARKVIWAGFFAIIFASIMGNHKNIWGINDTKFPAP